jgi:hypothetical protein
MCSHNSKEHKFTSAVEALAARAIVSAQDTVCGHASSSAALISSITSNPLIEFLLGIAFFSLTTSSVSSKRTDVSHPCNSVRMSKMLFFTALYKPVDNVM